MLTGLRRAVGTTKKAVLSRRVSKAVEYLSDSKGGEYEAIKRLTKDRGSRVNRVNRGKSLVKKKQPFGRSTDKRPSKVQHPDS